MALARSDGKKSTC
jgi:hypothetical protein